jgi:mono/diheme cytochrome c family protein
LYKRESYPFGKVPGGSVTATYRGGDDPYFGLDPFNSAENGASYNWTHQGAEAGRYTNDDIHAIRILAMEPTSDRIMTAPQGSFYSHASERLRILGEIPVRKFNGGKEPLDPDGNPDTSFLAKIPADIAWTFQTLDRRGMVLNMSQTWHQLRPGEIRTNCGGCHAHSQQPTRFEETAAAKADYEVWDLTQKSPLLSDKKQDESGKQWDKENSTGLHLEEGVKNVEFFRDIKPILQRSCVACHTKEAKDPPGNLVLDDDKPIVAIVNTAWPRTERPVSATSQLAATAGDTATPRAMCGCFSRDAACWCGRFSVSAWTAGPTTTCRPRPNPATPTPCIGRASRLRTRRITGVWPTWISRAATCRRPRRSPVLTSAPTARKSRLNH